MLWAPPFTRAHHRGSDGMIALGIPGATWTWTVGGESSPMVSSTSSATNHSEEFWFVGAGVKNRGVQGEGTTSGT
jgi:hypothetical protein|eukprot:COSAG01_NODE_5234_length_4395_cov_65.796555_5_plen_75_part_00